LNFCSDLVTARSYVGGPDYVQTRLSSHRYVLEKLRKVEFL